MSDQYNYDGLKALATRLGRPVSTLFVLSQQNDPFYIGPAQQAAAEWVAQLWHDHGVGRGHHLRRIHYRLISTTTPIRMLNGKAYENTMECWKALCDASADARHLGLVPANALVDRRNDEPLIYLDGLGSYGADIEVASAHPSLDISTITMPDLPRLRLHPPRVEQRYHVEIWAEKTTMNDILGPLAQRYGVNVVTGAGDLSITHCVNLVERAQASGRPVRILYISDFDPAGVNMPVAVARKIEHRLYTDGLDLDIQVRPVVLTHEQCIEYELPRIPIKESERRGARFEERYGEGATELDALEALRPGELKRILRREPWHRHLKQNAPAMNRGALISQSFICRYQMSRNQALAWSGRLGRWSRA